MCVVQHIVHSQERPQYSSDQQYERSYFVHSIVADWFSKLVELGLCALKIS
jgi:hypothetical protein